MQKDEGMKKELKEEENIDRRKKRKKKITPQFFKPQYIMHRFLPLLGLEPKLLDS